MTRKSILAACCILGVATVAAVPPQANAQALTPITISYQPTNYWALPFYVATKKGWWKEVGLDPKYRHVPRGRAASCCCGSRIVGRRGDRIGAGGHRGRAL